jgi:hypothetical protein
MGEGEGNRRGGDMKRKGKERVGQRGERGEGERG